MPGIALRLLIAAGIAVVLWLLKTVACRMAVRVHAGSQPSPVSADEVLWRSALAAAGLTVLTPVEILAIDDLFTTGVTSGLFWITAFTVIPAGGLFFSWVYALDDYPAGLGIFG